MDKNMIHIDDLVKQRLVGGEEREMPGSWSRMRDLLDKEMPEKRRVVGFYDWRRMLSVATGVLLLSALSVGGYHVVSTKFRGDNTVARSVANSPAAVQKPSTTSANGDHKTPVRTPAAETTNPGVKNTETTLSKGTSATEKQVYAAKTSKSGNGSNSPDQKTVVPVVATTAKASTQRNPTVAQPNVSTPASNPVTVLAVADKTSASSVTEKPKVDQNSKPIEIAINQSEKTSENTKTGPITTVQQRPLASSGKANRNPSLQPNPITEVASSVKPEGTKSSMPAPQQPDLPKDSLSKLTIVQRVTVNPLTMVSKLSADTIALERIAMDKPALASNTPATSDEAPVTVSPAASTSLLAADAADNNLVPLSNFKVQSRKTSKWNTRSFDEVVRDVKFNLAQTKFYTGISAGGNSYMFGPNNIGGFQLGLFGLFMFGDTWGAMAELKYIHRFNGGSTLKDDYVNTKPAMNGGYLQANVEHFFKFTTLQSIEMPIALRYAAGRLNLFGGLNLAYHFGINADEVTLNPVDSSFKPVVSGGMVKASPSVHYNDFRARFALGGVAGISYEVSPSIQLDLRATKNFWDNAYGLGAEQVSRQYYNAPSMQFSIFYRFSQKNQIPKAK